MVNDRKCIIIGAGASFGYDNSLIEKERPPLGRDLLSRSLEIGALAEWKYPKLFSTLIDYSRKFQRDSSHFSDIDVEEFLEYLAKELENINGKLNAGNPVPTPEQTRQFIAELNKDFKGTIDKINEAIPKDQDPNYELRHVAAGIQSAIGESWYLMFEVFRKYSLSYRSRFDAYQRLALSHLQEQYDLISLNYDIIFETAASYAGMLTMYPQTQMNLPLSDPRKIINVAKVHGSINWFNGYSKGISLGNTKERGYQLLHKISGFLYSNRVQIEPLVIINQAQLHQIDIQDILISGSKYYEPALLPPVGNYKDYDKVKDFKANWVAATNYVNGASELVIIGTKLREQDTKLRRMIVDNVSKPIRVTVVGSSEAESNVKKLLGSKISELEVIKNFEEYSRQL